MSIGALQVKYMAVLTEINYLDIWPTYVCNNAKLLLHLLTFMPVATISFEGSTRRILIGHMAYHILRLRM
jgi:hypothetical protein